MSSSTPTPDNWRTSASPSHLLAQAQTGLDRLWSGSRSHGQYLEIPLQTSRPNRRPSLDSTYSELSELSINSAELHHGGHHRPLLSPPNNHDHRLRSLSPAPPVRRRGFRGYIDAFWLRNKGVVLVLLAMVFGSGMNVAARLMETDGSHGKAMHPFQASAPLIKSTPIH